MNIIRYKPFNNLLSWNVDGILDSFFDDDFFSTAGKYPRVDVKEEDAHYVLEADLPGMTEKDLDVKVEGNLLTLSSAKTEEKKEKKNGYIVQERRSTAFSRSFVLPKNVDREKIVAKFKNGLLTMTLPKVPEAEPKKIEVKPE
ncbi:MAG: Hsp20/alpha crystallin family protein [Spirochaetales bacterium]|nr:Hsp20/alpha crystallin family protein [Spirochaetales bacterium]